MQCYYKNQQVQVEVVKALSLLQQEQSQSENSEKVYRINEFSVLPKETAIARKEFCNM